METHPLYTLELIWRPHEVWRSVAIDSAERWRALRTMRLSICWPHSVILLDLPRRGWVAVIPNRNPNYHWQLTVEYLGARKFHNWTCCTVGILSKYHAGIHWAPESDLFFHKCEMEVATGVSSFWHGPWWGIFRLCCCLFCTIIYSLGLNVSDQVRAGTASAWGRLLGSNWLCWSGSGGFLQIKLGHWVKPQTVDFYTADLYLILLSDYDDNFSKYNKK